MTSEQTFVVDESRPWLGGSVKGGDAACYFPELWTWLVEECGIKSVIDVGCGEGVAVRHFRDLGCWAIGIDGIAQDDSNIFEHDYTTGERSMTRTFDLCWSCEFVEHVEEKFVPNFLATFQSAKLVLMTHASPGQGGHHHMNCRTSDYWQGVMAGIGYRFDALLTNQTRVLAAQNNNQWNHYVRSGMAFRRRLNASST